MGLCDFIGKEKPAPAIISSLPPPLQKDNTLTPIEEKPEAEKHEEEAAVLSCLCCYLCLLGLVQ
jgi:hypothetical protein